MIVPYWFSFLNTIHILILRIYDWILSIMYQWCLFTLRWGLNGCLQILHTSALANYYCPFILIPGTFSISRAIIKSVSYLIESVLVLPLALTFQLYFSIKSLSIFLNKYMHRDKTSSTIVWEIYKFVLIIFYLLISRKTIYLAFNKKK